MVLAMKNLTCARMPHKRSLLRLMLMGVFGSAVGFTHAVAQEASDQTLGRLITVGANGGTIDTDGSSDTFSLAPGNNQLTVTNSNEGKGSSLEISGPGDRVGGLNVSGTHTKVVFSGPGATVSGPVTITNRTNSLHFNGSGTRVTGPVANYGTLIFGQSGTALVAGSISGTGKVVQKGPGVTRITGNNSYSGGTLIEQGGTVIVSSNRNLGAPDAPVILNGGTLRTVGDVRPGRGEAVSAPERLDSAEALNERELQSLAGANQAGPSQLGNTSQAVAGQTVSTPSWTLSAGGLVGQQIARWGDSAGWHVIWHCKRDWVVSSTARFQGDFKTVASQVLEDIATQGAPIHGIFYQGNHTLVVTGDGQ